MAVTTTTIDHLFVGEQPPVRTAPVTVADGQTCARGAAMGKILYGAVTAAADGSNTGDGTVTALATVVSEVLPIVGDYVFKCIEAVTNGGVFKLINPYGAVINGYIPLTAGAGATTVVETGGLTFTVTDGTTDFAVDDFFTITVAAGSGSVSKLDKTAVDGTAQIYGILYEAVITSGATATSMVYLEGKFNSGVVTFVSGTAYTDVAADARTKGIYFGSASY